MLINVIDFLKLTEKYLNHSHALDNCEMCCQVYAALINLDQTETYYVVLELLLKMKYNRYSFDIK